MFSGVRVFRLHLDEIVKLFSENMKDGNLEQVSKWFGMGPYKITTIPVVTMTIWTLQLFLIEQQCQFQEKNNPTLTS